ncbi:streptophobe family protein [Streptomyces sp. I05A-00742]|uniref:streptophobe family protein n=1 Tax=Streptomyces sp. I05A-00742 TaxID=2732853 RepID=UPI00289F872A|nr:streptophobe family protein [Streptomyces sp. I05A-00742]
MSQLSRSRPRESARAWAEAFGAVAAAVAAMVVTAALGLWAAGADDLPSGAFPGVLAATVVAGVGGTVELTGGAGAFGRTGATLAVVPLSVTLSGALAAAAALLLPLRHGPAPDGRELLARAARTAVLWVLALLPFALTAHHTFRISLGDSLLDELGDALGVQPEAGFRTDVPATLARGLLWLVVLYVVIVLAARRTPLPPPLRRVQEAVRPPVRAVVGLLLGYVLLGLVVGVVTLITRGHSAETAAVLLLGLPNLAWMALGVGLGGAWDGRVPDSIGLPVPHALAAVLREPGGGSATVDLASLGRYDDRAWVLVVVAALALAATGFLMARRFPAPWWRQAVRLAPALAVALVAAGLLTRISARYGLSLIGLGELDAFGGEVRLRPRLPLLLGLGALWGLVAGALGGVLARVSPERRRIR